MTQIECCCHTLVKWDGAQLRSLCDVKSFVLKLAAVRPRGEKRVTRRDMQHYKGFSQSSVKSILSFAVTDVYSQIDREQLRRVSPALLRDGLFKNKCPATL